MKKFLAVAVTSAALAIAPASAAVFSGSFEVTAVNVTDVDDVASQATMANYMAALADAGAITDTFTFTGSLDFITTDGSDSTTVADWLATAGGVVSGLDPVLDGTQLSKPDVFADPGSATSTFFYFTPLDDVAPGDFTVTHDDGFAIFEDGALLGGEAGPTTETVTEVFNFMGGDFSLLYVATNGDPSILEVDFEAVPLPAALPLFLAGMGAFGFANRRRKQTA